VYHIYILALILMSSFGYLRFFFTHTYNNFSCFLSCHPVHQVNVTFHVCLRRQVAAVFETIIIVSIRSPMAQKHLVDQSRLIIEASRSHPDTPHSVGLLWTTDKPNAENSTDNIQHAEETDSNPQSQQARGRKPTS
jgi:hypothetical protein